MLGVSIPWNQVVGLLALVFSLFKAGFAPSMSRTRSPVKLLLRPMEDGVVCVFLEWGVPMDHHGRSWTHRQQRSLEVQSIYVCALGTAVWAKKPRRKPCRLVLGGHIHVYENYPKTKEGCPLARMSCWNRETKLLWMENLIDQEIPVNFQDGNKASLKIRLGSSRLFMLCACIWRAQWKVQELPSKTCWTFEIYWESTSDPEKPCDITEQYKRPTLCWWRHLIITSWSWHPCSREAQSTQTHQPLEGAKKVPERDCIWCSLHQSLLGRFSYNMVKSWSVISWIRARPPKIDPIWPQAPSA